MSGKNTALRMLLEAGVTQRIGDAEISSEIAELFAPLIESESEKVRELAALKKEVADMKESITRIIAGGIVCEWDD